MELNKDTKFMKYLAYASALSDIVDEFEYALLQKLYPENYAYVKKVLIELSTLYKTCQNNNWDITNESNFDDASKFIRLYQHIENDICDEIDSVWIDKMTEYHDACVKQRHREEAKLLAAEYASITNDEAKLKRVKVELEQNRIRTESKEYFENSSQRIRENIIPGISSFNRNQPRSYATSWESCENAIKIGDKYLV
jgi:hypothetical protein